MAVRRRKKQAPPADSPEAQKERLLKEINVLDMQKKGIEAAIKSRKAAMRQLMDQAGDRAIRHEYYGEMAFTPRRSFKVADKKVLSRRLTKEFLLEGFKPNATIVDSLAQSGISIEGMIDIGVSENLVYRPPSTKEAEARRKAAIEESRKATEAKVAELAAKL